MIHLSNVTYTYPNSFSPAIDTLSLDVSKGCYAAVLGANGSGKSTLARCITSLLKPQTGSLIVQVNENIAPIGMVFQVPSDQIIGETAELDVAFGPENIGLEHSQMIMRVNQSLAYFSLSDLTKQKTVLLSTGQKQMLALAGVHVLSPTLLVLDEPTSMLSSHLRSALLDYLDSFHEDGGTILHITHDIDEALRAQRIVVLKNGHLVFDSSPELFKTLSTKTLVEWSLAGDVASLADTPKRMVKSTASASILCCEHLSCGPISDLSFSCNPGSITAIVGESGSGKSLLLELLANLQLPTCGTITFSDGVKAALAVQESEASLFEEFVADDVAFAPKNQGVRGSLLLLRVQAAMESVALPFDQFADRRTFSLSGGEKRKAALAGILAMDTSVILLDEPQSALDQKSRFHLQQCLLQLASEGKTVIFTTSREEETAIADAVVELTCVPKSVFTEEKKRENLVQNNGRLSADQRLLKKLRNGAQGSWVCENTLLHQLPPLHKYVLLISFLVGSLLITSIPFLVSFIVIEFIILIFARYPLRSIGKRMLVILPWLLVISLVQYFFFPETSQPALFILRFVALLLPLSLFLHISSNTEIMYGIEDILSPLRLFRIPIRDIALVTGIVFRFIPILYEEASRITAARIVRFASIKTHKGILQALHAATSLFVPLMMRTLLRSAHLSEAIFARYYGKAKNSRYLHWQTKPSHFILLLAVTLFVTGYVLISL